VDDLKGFDFEPGMEKKGASLKAGGRNRANFQEAVEEAIRVGEGMRLRIAGNEAEDDAPPAPVVGAPIVEEAAPPAPVVGSPVEDAAPPAPVVGAPAGEESPLTAIQRELQAEEATQAALAAEMQAMEDAKNKTQNLQSDMLAEQLNTPKKKRSPPPPSSRASKRIAAKRRAGETPL
jgi:hypothetical protein